MQGYVYCNEIYHEGKTQGWEARGDDRCALVSAWKIVSAKSRSIAPSMRFASYSGSWPRRGTGHRATYKFVPPPIENNLVVAER
jgi:hypothetical protein